MGNQYQRHREYHLAGCKSRGGFLFLVSLPHCFVGGFRSRSFVHGDCIHDQPIGAVAIDELETQISRRKKKIGTHWDSGLLHHHDYFISANPSGIGRETHVQGSAQSKGITRHCYRVDGWHHWSQGTYLVRMH